MRGPVQRDTAGIRLRVHIEAEIDQHLHCFERVAHRPLVGDPFNPADAGSDCSGVTSENRVDLRIGAMREQQLHELDVA